VLSGACVRVPNQIDVRTVETNDIYRSQITTMFIFNFRCSNIPNRPTYSDVHDMYHGYNEQTDEW